MDCFQLLCQTAVLEVMMLKVALLIIDVRKKFLCQVGFSQDLRMIAQKCSGIPVDTGIFSLKTVKGNRNENSNNNFQYL